jgi:hypothetical protein
MSFYYPNHIGLLFPCLSLFILHPLLHLHLSPDFFLLILFLITLFLHVNVPLSRWRPKQRETGERERERKRWGETSLKNYREDKCHKRDYERCMFFLILEESKCMVSSSRSDLGRDDDAASPGDIEPNHGPRRGAPHTINIDGCERIDNLCGCVREGEKANTKNKKRNQKILKCSDYLSDHH